MLRGPSLRLIGGAWVALAFAAGATSAALWLRSSRAWDQHLSRADAAGFTVYETLRLGGQGSDQISVTALSIDNAARAEVGDFDRLPDAPQPAYVTNVSILINPATPTDHAVLTLGIVSDELVYPVSDIVSNNDPIPAEKLGKVTRLLATYCSEPMLYARYAGKTWQRVDGTDIWGCEQAPMDLRVPAAIAAIVALAALLTHVGNTTASFETFAQALRSRRRFGGPESYEAEGPTELRSIVAAVNSYLEAEREQLAQRAIVLSGVSHDLGTPATRLRLRAALIPDDQLRGKLEADIDQMTGMIESVLTYTRSEINAEEPRKLSLTSLIDALVADYQDTGSPVLVRDQQPVVVEGAGSVFMSRRGHSTLPDERRVLVTARPISLQRAISNLIDNALKYGRRAVVELETDADTATIIVEDEGSDYSVADVERLMAPFERGENTMNIGGFGLGLTIVATVANQHGGTLRFETGAKGLRARLSIQRT
ncbi:ATP-binding protein [Aliiroseovarius sp. S1339]|uniref:sensor histidine kinase n=1 Tax=Aliiroseovarius sp. S1339 TaxID=2936990 RepID=UPI0020C05DDD|nr:ATP-binding protein [Aliiroseovarius sp. S1339]MCK8464977.1 ATP-binding protein [Aliiroseovarius sp. S1339]